MKNEHIYACIDLEVSGFDPAEEEILEVAVVKFSFQDGQYIELGKYEKLFRPKKDEVSKRILDLTGIKQEDLATSPFFEDCKAEITMLLQNTVLVGHGLQLDLAFLNFFGVLQGEVEYVDTLEMAQVLLPTYHSYNLENLANYFGMPPRTAHRAMSDVLAVLKVITGLSSLYIKMSVQTKETFSYPEVAGFFPWVEILEDFSVVTQDTESAVQDNENTNLKDSSFSSFKYQFSEPTFIAFPNIVDAFRMASLLGVHDKVYRGIKYDSDLAREFLKDNEKPDKKSILAALKILVFENEYSDSGEPINTSMVGKEMVSMFEAKQPLPISSETILGDYGSIYSFAGKQENLDIVDVPHFINWLDKRSGTTFSWGRLEAQLFGVYNPVTDFGQLEQKEVVLNALGALDLCFASILLLLKKHLRLSEGVLDWSELDYFLKTSILIVIQNLQTKLNSFALLGLLDYSCLDQIIDFLKSSETSTKTSCWIEFSDRRFFIYSKPSNLSENFKKYTANYNKVTFTPIYTSQNQSSFLKSRLGVRDLSLSTAVVSSPKIEIQSFENSEKLVNLLTSDQSQEFTLFFSLKYAKDLFDAYVVPQGNMKQVRVQGIHGGPNKLFRNQFLNANSLTWLLVNSVTSLPILYCEQEVLPFVLESLEFLHHPYLSRLANNHEGYETVKDWFKAYMENMILNATKAFKGVNKIIIYHPASMNFENFFS